MNKFIYVFTEQDRDTMLSHGYKLITAVGNNSDGFSYIFENSTVNIFDYEFVSKAVMSNSLSFNH